MRTLKFSLVACALLFWMTTLSALGQANFWHQSLWWDGFVVTSSGIGTMTNTFRDVITTGNFFDITNTSGIGGIAISSAGSSDVYAFNTGGTLQLGGLVTGATVDTSGNLVAASFTGPGSSITALNATQLTSGLVPSARLTGVDGSGLTNLNSSQSTNVGIYFLANNLQTNGVQNGHYTGQLGYTANAYIYVWNGSSWNGSQPWLLIPGFAQIGSQYSSGTGAATQMNEYLSGDPTLQTIAHQSDDSVHRIIGMNPFGSGGGVGFVITTTTATGNGTAQSTNSSAQPIYYKGGDQNAYSLIGVGEQAVTADDPAVLLLVADSKMFPIVIGSQQTISNQLGVFPWVYFDGTNGQVNFPQWLGTNNFPLNSATNANTLVVSGKINQVTLGTNATLYSQNGAQQLVQPNGFFNNSAFDPNGTLSGTNMTLNQAQGTSAAITLHGIATIGINANTGQTGNELWFGDASSGICSTISGPNTFNGLRIWQNLDFGWKVDGAGDIGASNGVFNGPANHTSLRPNNVWVKNVVEAGGGISTLLSNTLAPTSITAPATTVNWTNPIQACIEVYIDNSGVTGTSIKKNGTQIFSSLIGDVTIGLQKNEFISLTYTVGTPSIKWSPR